MSPSSEIAKLPKDAEHFGRCTDLEALDRLVNVQGMHLVDVGCGDGTLARALAQRGAQILGIEPDAAQAAKNRAAPPSPGVTLIEAGAERIPLESGTADGVIFSRSLHHVAKAESPKALAEARRVIKPEGGFLLVIEPTMVGSFAALQKPFHDESDARSAALGALATLVPRHFAREREVFYTISITFPDFGSFVEQMVGATFNVIRPEAVETPEVRHRFEAGRCADGYAFDQLMRINLFLTEWCRGKQEPFAGHG